MYPDFSLPLQGKVWVSCNLGTPSIKLSYMYIASLYMHTNFSVQSFRKVYPSVPKKRLFVEIKPKNLGTRGYRPAPPRRLAVRRRENGCQVRDSRRLALCWLNIQSRGGYIAWASGYYTRGGEGVPPPSPPRLSTRLNPAGCEAAQPPRNIREMRGVSRVPTSLGSRYRVQA